MAYETIRRNVGTRKVLEKTQIVRLARRATPINRTRKEHTEILFVGSVNFPSILTQGQRSVLEGISRFSGICSFASHENFESKGGREVFEVFSILSRQYDRLRLTVRAKVPADIRARYGANPNIRIVENPVTSKEMDKMFLDADIFLFPSHMSPGMAFLDAMNYELPIVTIGACNNAEIVQHGKTGFVCATSERVPYWHANGLPAGNTFDHIKAIHSPDHHVVMNLASCVRELIEDDTLRTRMGREGKRLLETGEFSIEHRNRALREIIEQTLHR
jgi:glycosyltransferase involved in cell wall biosynthesis